MHQGLQQRNLYQKYYEYQSCMFARRVTVGAMVDQNYVHKFFSTPLFKRQNLIPLLLIWGWT